jgi:hydroxymethylpyrimidine kinase/phosphomethylpyrimidine kinase
VSTPRVLLLGGLDPSGGAGLTVDVRMAHILGVHGLAVVTTVTVQNRHGFVAAHPASVEVLRESLRAAVGDGPVQAIKLGMIADAGQLPVVMDECAAQLPGVPIVVDPVLSATSGGMVPAAELVAAYLAQMPRIRVLTPNIPELAQLAPGGPTALLELGCPHVFVTGGHAEGDAAIEDRLCTAEGVVVVRHPRLHRGPIRGTGCALATAVASRLAHGDPVEAACRGAVEVLIESIGRTAASTDGLPVPLDITAARNSE